MPSAPAFQFYPADWVTGTLDFTLEQRGAYMLLLCWSWEHGPVPNDHQKLAKILGLSRYKLAGLWPIIRKKFYRADGGWRNARLESIRAEQAKYRELQAAKGRASAQQRFNRGSSPVAPPVATETQPSDLRSSISIDQDQDQKQSAREFGHTEAPPPARPPTASPPRPTAPTSWTKASEINHRAADDVTATPDSVMPHLTKLAHTAVFNHGLSLDAYSECAETLKRAASLLRLPYTGDTIRRALESAEVQRVARA